MSNTSSRELVSAALPAERSFGVLFVVVFALAGGYAFYVEAPVSLTATLSAMSAVLLLISFFKPKLFSPFNRAWAIFGFLLGRIVSPMVLGLLFFAIITPVAVVTKIAGRDALKLRRKATSTHWVERTPTGSNPDSFKNQF